MATLTSQLILSLIDRVTAPARGIAGAVDKMQGRLADNNRRLDAMRGRMVEAAAVAYGLARALTAPVQAAADFESQLEDIGQKAEIPVERLGALGRSIQGIARDTNQASTQIASAIDNLVGRGASEDVALAAADPIGRAATAYRASTTDLASAAWSAVDNLKVPSEQIEASLDIMAQAGKAGAFEMRDMAQYFPSLGAAYQALGQEGTDAVADLAAALQVVRKGTGDSSSAATNLNNVLQKIYAPGTVKKFGEAGIDIFKEMEAAAQRGLTPIEAIAEITSGALQGDLTKIGFLFEDAQVQQGLRAIIQNMDEYRRIREEAMQASGVVAEDYERRVAQAEGTSLRWRAAIESVNIAIGQTLLPLITDLANTIVPLVDRISALAQAHPGLTRAVIATAAGLVALRIAALAAQFSLLWMRGGLIMAGIAGLRSLGIASKLAALAFWPLSASLRSTRTAMIGFSAAASIAGTGGALKIMGASLLGLLNPLHLVRAAMVALKFAIIGTGIGLVLVGIATAGAWIYRNWQGIKEMFAGIGEGIRTAFPGLAPIIDSVAEAAGTLFGWFDKLTGPVEATAEEWRAFGVSVGTTIGEIVAKVAALPGQILAFAADMAAAGAALIQSLWDGAMAKFDAFVAWMKEIPSRIKAAIGRIDLSSIISWPKMPSWLGGAAAAANDNARAAGGPITAGRTYLVGEEGPELITPSRSGYVHPADETAAMASGGDARRSVSAGGLSIGSLVGELHVHPAPGMDEQALAEKTARAIDRAIRDAFAGGHWNGGYRVA